MLRTLTDSASKVKVFLGYNGLMKKIIVYALIIISVLILMLRSSSLIIDLLGIKQKSGISITSAPVDATVFLNNEEVGKTPFEAKDLDISEYNIRLQKDQSIWQGSVKLNAGTVAIVNRDLAADVPSSAGEVLTLKKGQGITLISNPKSAKVTVDGSEAGISPLNINLKSGEHTIIIDHQSYIKRSIRVNLPDGYNLTIVVDLALSEADLSTVSTPVIKTTPEVVVKDTPTGFLRVRDKPSLLGKEISQVKPGETLILLEEDGAWDRVRLADGVEGYVSASYVEKKIQ